MVTNAVLSAQCPVQNDQEDIEHSQFYIYPSIIQAGSLEMADKAMDT